MPEQNVVAMSENGGRFLSEEVHLAATNAAERLDAMDADPIFREALARAGIRDFALGLAERFPEMREEIADQFDAMAGLIRPEGAGRSTQSRGGLKTQTAVASSGAGGAQHAEDRKSPGSAGGRIKTDSKGAVSGRASGVGARDNGSERFREVDSFLRSRRA
jgi:hypothetical protein